MENLGNIFQMSILQSETELDDFLNENQSWLYAPKFHAVCRRYEFPDKPITLVVEHYYIDSIERDIYHFYHYLSPSYSAYACKRIFLFQGRHTREKFLKVSNKRAKDDLQQNFLGVIVVRKPYFGYYSLSHTFGKTLLDPFKMVIRERSKNDEEGDIIFDENDEFLRPVFLQKRSYRVHLLGNTYTIRAFPFSSQDGIALSCAENAIELLCDYAFFSKILPSDLQENLKTRSSQRILPSHGLYVEDISYLLREFGFSPIIYRREQDYENMGGYDTKQKFDNSFFVPFDLQHKTNYKKWFHYYVESGIPIVTIIAPGSIMQMIDETASKHAVLVIGHSKRKKSLSDCALMWLDTDFPCVDTAEFYEYYIVQDDNQIPYCEERFDHFTAEGNYRLDSYIVPLPRHVFLEAPDAVSICDTIIEQMKDDLKSAFALMHKQEEQILDISKENPLVIRYFLANSADYKQNRILNGGDVKKDNTLFYSSIPMPKSVWVAEVSTYQLYQTGKAVGEVVLDATAPNLSKIESVLLIRCANHAGYRMPNASYNDLVWQLDSQEYVNLPTFYQMYSNFSSGNQDMQEKEEEP